MRNLTKSFLSERLQAVALTNVDRFILLRSGAMKLPAPKLAKTHRDYCATQREKYLAAGLRSDGKPFRRKFKITKMILDYAKEHPGFALVDIPRPEGVTILNFISNATQLKRRKVLIVVGQQSNGLTGRRKRLCSLFSLNPERN